MNEIKFNILRDSKEERPYVDLIEQIGDRSEINFGITEIMLTLLYGLVEKFEGSTEIDPLELEQLKYSTKYIRFLSERMAIRIADQMDTVDEANEILGNKTEDDTDGV